jgi:hypothetical protein
MDSNQLLRVTLGFLFAPAIGLEVLGLLFCANHPTQSFAYCVSGTVMIVGIGGLVAYPAALVLGIPFFALCRKRQWLRLWQVALGSTLVGALSTFVFSFVNLKGLTVALEYIPLFCGVGFVSGIAFWLIAVFRNRALTAGSRGDAPQSARA